MSPSPPLAYLLLADDVARKTARAMLMATQIAPTELAPQRGALRTAAQALEAHPGAIAIIELAALPPEVPHLVALAETLGAKACSRVLLVRGDMGPLWDTDRQWISALGYAGIVGELSPEALAAEEAPAVQLALGMLGRPSIERDRLAQFFGAMQIKAETRPSRRARARALAQRSPDALAAALADGVPTGPLRYHLRTYPECATGESIVTWLRSACRLDIERAELLGQTLQKLGYLHHVTYEQPLKANGNFFRIDSKRESRDARPDRIYAEMCAKGGPAIADRRFLARTWEQCFVGREAIDWASRTQGLSRPLAESVLDRLLLWRLFEHVTREHLVRDDDFFYRYLH